MPLNYDTLAFALRKHFLSSPHKSYYLSAAPQCPCPDASLPAAMLVQCDFVWVQFYNNPSCELGSSGFDASVRQWSSVLMQAGPPALAVTGPGLGEKRAASLNMGGSPRLYIGAPAFKEAGATAYASIGEFCRE